MNEYKNYLKLIKDNNYLISMVPVEELLRFGYEIGLNEKSKVLDLCCGYGTVLKIWSEAFGISGVGVDLDNTFLSIGRERLTESGIDKIKLICNDVLTYEDNNKYDVVILSETFESIENTLLLGDRFLKPDGIIAYQKLYSKTQTPPKELTDFDEEVLPLSELNSRFNALGYYITSMASDSAGKWEHYVINWSGNRDWKALKNNPDNAELKKWIDYWYNIYFDYRRPYEGQALFGLKRIEGE